MNSRENGEVSAVVAPHNKLAAIGRRLDYFLLIADPL